MQSLKTFRIGNHTIGNDNPTFIIAELSCNHNGDINCALELIREAAKAGANAIKIQTYTADTMTLNCDSSDFKLHGTIWKDQSLYKLYEQAYTPWEWTKILQQEAIVLGMQFFSSPFDPTAVDFLETLQIPIPVYKVASFEIVDYPLLKRIAQTKKPVIVSTGMASLAEIAQAIKILQDNGSGPIALLKCTSAYPADPKDANLLTIPNMRDTFNCFVGLSDHTLGIEVPIVSVALGATIIEKHFTLSRESGSPDDSFSLTPGEFKAMVDSVRLTEKILGKITYGGVKSEEETRQLRRSLYVVKDIKAGEIFTTKNIRSIRPAFGLPSINYDAVIGKIARKDIDRGTALQWNLID
jgi:pseudaminic acid synthase